MTEIQKLNNHKFSYTSVRERPSTAQKPYYSQHARRGQKPSIDISFTKPNPYIDVIENKETQQKLPSIIKRDNSEQLL